MRKDRHAYFFNESCECFPCHEGADKNSFNCLFCFCPLYALGEGCGGDFRYTAEGIKDCSGCLRPHRPKNYGEICARCREVAELARKKQP